MRKRADIEAALKAAVPESAYLYGFDIVVRYNANRLFGEWLRNEWGDEELPQKLRDEEEALKRLLADQDAVQKELAEQLSRNIKKRRKENTVWLRSWKK